MINFSENENNFSNLIDLEKFSLISTLEIQKNFNKQILIFMKKFMSNIDLQVDIDPNNKSFLYLNEATTCLNNSNSNISILNNLLKSLENLSNCNDNLVEEIKSYNTNFKDCMTSIYANTENIEKFIKEITINNFSELSEKKLLEITQPNSIPVSTISNKPKKTLVISEKTKKVILPYDINNIEKIYTKHKLKYSSTQDVIDKLYTKPISYYKFSPIARFKEAYKLIKEKEKGSTFKALSLAFELLGNYSLHPAIISACSSLDELDIYLACLEENSLQDFHFFNIKFDVPLSISKLAQNDNY